MQQRSMDKMRPTSSTSNSAHSLADRDYPCSVRSKPVGNTGLSDRTPAAPLLHTARMTTRECRASSDAAPSATVGHRPASGIVRPIRDSSTGDRPHARCRQFDRQRQTVEPITRHEPPPVRWSRRSPGRVLHSGPGPGTAARHRLDSDGDRDQPLASHHQRLAARDQHHHLRARRNDLFHSVGRSGKQVLTVVDHEQQALGAQTLNQSSPSRHLHPAP